MAETMVFVDDVVLGTLPPICVKTGTPTTDRLVVRHEVWTTSGLGIAWLLLLAGPLGWLGLFVFSLTRRPEGTLRVELPFSEAAHQELRRLRRMRVVAALAVVGFAGLAVVGLVLATFDGTVLGSAAAAAALFCVIRWILAVRQGGRAAVDIDLDASRRWVTLGRVHPNFVEAVAHMVDRPSRV
jgi:hypothetical protein